jgi:hypothetical protein
MEAKTKEKVRQFFIEKSMGSYMNITKWQELMLIINDLPFQPAFIFKYLLDVEHDTQYGQSLNTESVTYFGDWSLGTEPAGLSELKDFYLIQFMKIKPLFSINKGKYAIAEKIDLSDHLFKN